ncbi:aldo/keto reductase [Clavibacter sp. Sh2126]|uniref:aldo/keto reductase n=1 Tax=Clavibacter sp. Sh2126 TaxID=3397678 RepID=UPI0039DFB872
MKHIHTGTGLDVGRIGLGCMGMSAFYDGHGQDEAESIRTLHRAVDQGVTLFDTAEAYGPFTNERLVGSALAGRRDDIVIATKFGLLKHAPGKDAEDYERGMDSSPTSIRIAVEASLQRLGTDRIDVLYQHRVDPAVPIEETVGAMKELVDEGKVLHLGLSEAGPDTIRRAHAVHPIAALQSEYSIWTRDPEGPVLEVLRELGIGLVAYSPLGRGFLTGAISSAADLSEADYRSSSPRFAEEAFAQNMRIVDAVKDVAGELDATPAQVALAWILAQGDDIAVIPGTKRVSRLDENVAADAVTLSADQLARLSSLPTPVGDRYADMGPVGR